MSNERVQHHEDGSKERWRDIPGYEGCYRVSDRGRIKSLTRQVSHWRGGGHLRSAPSKILKEYRGRYYSVTLSVLGKTKSWFVQYLVLMAFVGPRPDQQHKALHKDDDPANNNLSNLYWGTQKQNCQDAARNGLTLRGEKVGTSKLKENDVHRLREMYATGEWTYRRLADEFGITQLTAFKAIRRKTWKHI